MRAARHVAIGVLTLLGAALAGFYLMPYVAGAIATAGLLVVFGG